MPKNKTQSHLKLGELFRAAARDYFYLLNRDYPERPILKVIGDRYRLSRNQRQILFRGIASQANARSRKAKIRRDIRGEKIYIDGYNVLLTVMNYFLGKMVFIANDGILRDVGENYGSIRDKDVFERAVDLLLDWLKTEGSDFLTIYLDSPVSHSGLHMKEMEQKMAGLAINGAVVLARSADYELKRKTDGMIATSDSIIIAVSPCPVVDLARHALESKFSVDFIHLGDLLPDS